MLKKTLLMLFFLTLLTGAGRLDAQRTAKKKKTVKMPVLAGESWTGSTGIFSPPTISTDNFPGIVAADSGSQGGQGLSFGFQSLSNSSEKSPSANSAGSKSSSAGGKGGKGGGSWNMRDTGGEMPEVRVKAFASPAAMKDCSRGDAYITQQVINVSTSARACASYTLTVPEDSPRYGERYICDDNSKFHPFGSDWHYDRKTMTYTADPYYTRNSGLPPGFYILSVMDEWGHRYQSEKVVVRREGHAACNAAAVCRWTTSDPVIGPCMGPGFGCDGSAPCSAANQGAKASAGGGVWTCVCR